MEVEPRKNWTPKILYWPLLGKLPSATVRKFDIFRWGHYLKNFEFYVLNVPPILWKRGDTIQGRTLYKGRHYLRKYGISFEYFFGSVQNATLWVGEKTSFKVGQKDRSFNQRNNLSIWARKKWNLKRQYTFTRFFRRKSMIKASSSPIMWSEKKGEMKKVQICK